MADINKIQVPGITDPLIIKDDSGTQSDHKHTKSQITDFPIIDASVSYNSNNLATEKGISNYIASRGENLLTNGTALLGNGYNFTGIVFDPTDNYYCGGCFTATGSRSIATNEFMPVNPNQQYILDFYAKCNDENVLHYVFVDMFDIDKLQIAATHIMWREGSTTTLARDLKNGDTIVYLTSTAGFQSAETATHRRGLIFWNWKNSFGYEYKPETYSRNVWHDLWADGNIAIDKTNNTITLSTPWNHGTFNAGVSVSQSDSGGTFSYLDMGYISPANTWVRRTSTIGTIGKNNQTYKFREGTAFVRLGWLANYANKTSTQGDKNNATLKLSNISFSLSFPNIPVINNENKILLSTSTKGLAQWSNWSQTGFLKTNTAGQVTIDTNRYLALSGGNLTGHLYLTGTQSSTTSTTTQLLFTNADKSVNYASISASSNYILGFNSCICIDGNTKVLKPYTGTTADLGSLTVPWTNICGTNIYQNGTKVSVEGHTHFATTYVDSRDSAPTPASVAAYNGLRIDFKNKTASGITSTGSWTAVVTMDGYSDTSGGYPSQLGFSMSDLSESRRLYFRSPKSASVWGDWNTLAFLSDIPTISTNITTDAASDTQTTSPKAVKTYVDDAIAAAITTALNTAV